MLLEMFYAAQCFLEPGPNQRWFGVVWTRVSNKQITLWHLWTSWEEKQLGGSYLVSKFIFLTVRLFWSLKLHPSPSHWLCTGGIFFFFFCCFATLIVVFLEWVIFCWFFSLICVPQSQWFSFGTLAVKDNGSRVWVVHLGSSPCRVVTRSFRTNHCVATPTNWAVPSHQHWRVCV